MITKPVEHSITTGTLYNTQNCLLTERLEPGLCLFLAFTSNIYITQHILSPYPTFTIGNELKVAQKKVACSFQQCKEGTHADACHS